MQQPAPANPSNLNASHTLSQAQLGELIKRVQKNIHLQSLSKTEPTLVALSGGVDSAVAAYLLKESGVPIKAAFMQTWMNESGSDIFANCPWEADLENAQAVASHLGIELEVVDLIQHYKTRVVSYLIEGYQQGRTPNPDIMCNREIKFGIFLTWALENGFSQIATGHYAQRSVGQHANQPMYQLHKGLDGNKDQSYFLTLLNQQQLKHACFPLGALHKPHVRQIAQAINLPNANRKDSQGICFLGKVNINDFLEQYLPQSPGNIVTPTGEVRGTHKGLHRYTLGQRKGIDVPSNTDNQHFVVVAKNYESNELVIAFDAPTAPGLYQSEVRLQHLSWVHPESCPLTAENPAMELEAKTRYRDPCVPATLTATQFSESGTPTHATIHFNKPERALASGQLCAFYTGAQLIGGGFYTF